MKAKSLHNFNAQTFLKKYWQKRPLLIRKAFDSNPAPVHPEELAGLACEPGVFSRIVLERGGKKPWEVRRGPFKPAHFQKLPKSHWTLLVNGVDRFFPEVNALYDYFTFLPFWRFDDIMISYATRGGNVGAHVDNYDVFLIQAAGKREWRITEEPVWEDDFKEGLDIKLLKKFKPTKKLVLGPGDILYLPPRVPHHGISLDDSCLTYSIGFRAPGYQALLDSLATDTMSRVNESFRYTDQNLSQGHPGELSRSARSTIRNTLLNLLFNEPEFNRWLAEYLTTPEGEFEETSIAPFLQVSPSAEEATKATIVRAEGAKLLFVREVQGISLFINGTEHLLPLRSLSFVKALTQAIRIPLKTILRNTRTSQEKNLLHELIHDGILRLE